MQDYQPGQIMLIESADWEKIILSNNIQYLCRLNFQEGQTNFVNTFQSQQISSMLFMIIERFHPGKARAVYERFEEKGRLLPDGVVYLDSWIDEQISICFQVMESNSVEKIHQWIGEWIDLADFEVIPVINSAAAKAKIFAR